MPQLQGGTQLGTRPRGQNKRPLLNINPVVVHWAWAFLFAILAAGFITATTFYIQPGSSKAVLTIIQQQPLILFLNYLPPLLMILLLFFIMNNIFRASAFTCAIFNVLSMVNRVKIELRDDPFVPRDFQLIQEAGSSMANFEIDLNYMLIALIVVSVIGFILLGHFCKTKKLPKGMRIGGTIVMLVCAILSNQYIYSSNVVYYRKLGVSNRSYITRVYTELGFTYCLLYNLNTYPVEKPDDFSKEEVEGWIKDYTGMTDVEEPEVKPHVFVIMNEAFSDISNDPLFAYTEENTPLKYYNELAASDQTITGQVVVPGFGGGTANAEFDVMTGMQTNMLSSVATSAFRVVGKNTSSLARLLDDQGYETSFMHPGDSWFYNRLSVYKYLGVQNQIYNEAYTSADKKGNMIGDEAVKERLLELFETHLATSEAPFFNYTTTIQNHMAYTVNKYGSLEIEEVPMVKEITQEAKDFFSV